MPKYKVDGSVRVGCSIEVEATDKDAALNRASESWPGLTGYAGNGASSGRLVGHVEDGVRIYALDDEPEWDDVSREA